MKLILTLLATLGLTACGTTAQTLTKSDLVYFPSQTISFVNVDECREAEKRLSKFPRELNRDNYQYYWLDVKTQKAFTLGPIGCTSGMTNTLTITSFYELAEMHIAKSQAKTAKDNFVKGRVDKLGI